MPDDNHEQCFKEALLANMSDYGIALSSSNVEALVNYYEILSRWNARLHLVAPCSPEEFATRHVLESLTLANHLPQSAKIADVGSGAGFPIIPCLVLRRDLTATLIEASQKKSIFLRETLKQLHLTASAEVVNRRFEETPTPDADFISCRALDEFSGKVSQLYAWAPQKCTLLLFGGDELGDSLQRSTLSFSKELLPRSLKRFLFVVTKK